MLIIKKYILDIFTVGNLLNILMEHDLNIPYNVLLAIAPNIPVLLMTAFVLQGHIRFYFKHKLTSFRSVSQKTRRHIFVCISSIWI